MKPAGPSQTLDLKAPLVKRPRGVMVNGGLVDDMTLRRLVLYTDFLLFGVAFYITDPIL